MGPTRGPWASFCLQRWRERKTEGGVNCREVADAVPTGAGVPVAGSGTVADSFIAAQRCDILQGQAALFRSTDSCCCCCCYNEHPRQLPYPAVAGPLPPPPDPPPTHPRPARPARGPPCPSGAPKLFPAAAHKEPAGRAGPSRVAVVAGHQGPPGATRPAHTCGFGGVVGPRFGGGQRRGLEQSTSKARPGWPVHSRGF